MLKLCEFCGNEFVTNSNRQKYCNRGHWRTCPSCGKMYVERYSENLCKPPRLCSPRCGSSKKIAMPYFQVISRFNDVVIVDSTKFRSKYENLEISKYFYSQNLKCIHLFPDDDLDRLESWSNKTNIHDASEFNTYKLNLTYAEEFIETNDIVKFKKSTKTAIGLVKNHEIFQILCFSNPRYNQSYTYEISHICTKQRCRIVGGIDSLTTSASMLLGVTDCVCYVDISKMFDYSELLSVGLKFHHRNVPRLRTCGTYDCGTDVLVF